MIKTILITGGTGLVGKQLVKLLVKKGYKINLLVRKSGEKIEIAGVKTFIWDIYKREIDKECIQDADAIIHLAGEEIAGKRWTDERKRQIIESRTESIRMIYDLMLKNKNQVNHIISASAIGYYGNRGNELLTESSLPFKNFLAETCVAWEEAVDEGEKLGLRIVKLRTGIILDSKGGALPQMAKPVKFGLGVILGSGSQWVSWIHVMDVLQIYTYALENENIKGVYNMVAPEPITFDTMTHAIAKGMKKSSLFFHVPSLFLKVALGEMSMMVLESTKVSSEKLEKAGYIFQYPNIQNALNEIYKKR